MVSPENTNWIYDYGLIDDIPVPVGNFLTPVSGSISPMQTTLTGSSSNHLLPLPTVKIPLYHHHYSSFRICLTSRHQRHNQPHRSSSAPSLATSFFITTSSGYEIEEVVLCIL